MTFEFHPDARVEFLEAIAYYETCREGFGLRSSREVSATINRVTLGPATWPKISENTRRCLTRRFPYAVIYEIRTNDILIIAVGHLSREPLNTRRSTKTAQRSAKASPATPPTATIAPSTEPWALSANPRRNPA
ncbi:MAG: type II toxin-antitoxin system RelE/ParE family toxin [Pyrinomonadaceae bacterium]